MRMMKDMFDTLVFSRQSFIEEKLINFILDGLGAKFEPMVVYIIGRIESLTKKLSLAKVKSIL